MFHVKWIILSIHFSFETFEWTNLVLYNEFAPFFSKLLQKVHFTLNKISKIYFIRMKYINYHEQTMNLFETMLIAINHKKSNSKVRKNCGWKKHENPQKMFFFFNKITKSRKMCVHGEIRLWNGLHYSKLLQVLKMIWCDVICMIFNKCVGWLVWSGAKIEQYAVAGKEMRHGYTKC